MFNRIYQVWAALRAKVSEADEQFVGQYLNYNEQKAFWGMGIPDQYHSLRVARDALSFSEKVAGIDRGLLVRCALLHDVGRRKGDVSTFDKIFTVLLHKLVSTYSKTWGREGRGGKIDNLRHAVFVYYHHPERSAAILQELGSDQKLIEIVAAHHRPVNTNDRTELKILKEADEKN